MLPRRRIVVDVVLLVVMLASLVCIIVDWHTGLVVAVVAVVNIWLLVVLLWRLRSTEGD